MQRIANSVTVQKTSKINLTDFFSHETTFVLKSTDNKDVYISISFLRHNQALYKFLLLLTLGIRMATGKSSNILYTVASP